MIPRGFHSLKKNATRHCEVDKFQVIIRLVLYFFDVKNKFIIKLSLIIKLCIQAKIFQQLFCTYHIACHNACHVDLRQRSSIYSLEV